MTAAAGAAAAAAISFGIASAFPASGAHAAGPAHDAQLARATGTTHPVTLRLNLAPMPEGTAAVGRGTVRISELGLTPGSAHAVELAAPWGATTVLGTLTANGAGQASATFAARVRGWSQLRVLDGATGTSPIAVTAPLGFGSVSGLYAVEDGHPFWGEATVVYSPSARRVSVTVTAFGLTPGAHAAHIHSGSCASQGPVVYMLQDFVAGRDGAINHQTRTVTGVTSFPAAGWYLNLHQGNSGNILDAAGQPTIFFRPLLCANI